MTFLYIVIGLVLIFDFINGFHDSANSIATVVSTKVLSPFAAVAMAAFFNFMAFLIFPLKVASTMSYGVVNPTIINLTVISSAIAAAIIWNLATWWLGLPSSSSHTLVGGLVGAAVACAGWSSVIVSGVLWIVIFIVVAPLLGMVMSFIISAIVIFLAKNHSPSGIDKHFRRLQLLSAAAFSLGHGGNDAQKTMGIIAILLFSVAGTNEFVSTYLYQPGIGFHVPLWITITCYSVIALGTLTGGWKVIKTLGDGLAKLKPVQGFCAETAGALTLIGTAVSGIPVSTTHTITGAIIGVGMTKGMASVKWATAKNIVSAWILTIPSTLVISGLIYLLISSFLNLS